MSVQYITARNSNICDDDADILVNTVNTVGIMGKGVALAFKQRWPSIMPNYVASCSCGRLRAGGCLLFALPAPVSAMPLFDPPAKRRHWAALATKANWRDPSRLEWIASGLRNLALLALDEGVRSIALPPPGCGNGGLDWAKVEPMVLHALDGFDLRIYAPRTT